MTVEKSEIHLALARLTDMAEGFDLSWSFSKHGYEERALFFLPATLTARDNLIAAAQVLGFDRAEIAAFVAALPGADALGLTLSRSGSVRLYLQYWDELSKRIAHGNTAPAPLYLGLKRFADGSARRDLYYCLPLAPEAEYRPDIETALQAFGADLLGIEMLFAQLSPETCIWTRTQGEGRQSWLATVRRAHLRPQDVINALAPVAQRAGVQAVIEALRKGALLHIAGGTDAKKGEFLSFYVETDRQGMSQFMQGLAL